MSEEKQKRLKTRLNRIAGQIGGVQRMVEEDRYCVDILTQISAIRSALDTVGVELLTGHIEGVRGRTWDRAGTCLHKKNDAG